jgi:Fe-S-cluster-containing dehydrogenase component
VIGEEEGAGPVDGGRTEMAERRGVGRNTPPADYDPHAHRYAWVLDVNKCIGCGACVRACEMENDVPQGHFRTWIERYSVSREGHVMVDSPMGGKNGFEPVNPDREITKSFFVPKMCNHCTETPCVQLCPVGASFRSPDGVVLVDDKRCIGCSYCIQACPYGSRFLHPETKTAAKCTMCYHRITRGLKPACVQACPTGSRIFGDLKQPGDEVAEIISTKQVQVLKPELHTLPNCYYIGVGKEVGS